MSSTRRRRVALVGVALLYALSIPWYRDGGAAPQLWWGLPDWVAVALGCYVGVALLNALAWRHTETGERPAPNAEREP